MFFVCCLGGRGPRPNSNNKKNTTPLKQQKNKHDPAPSERVFVSFAVWVGGRVCFFCCLGRGRVFFCCCLGRGRVFLLFGRGLFFFLLFGRVSCLLFCCLGAGRVFFCCLGGGRVCFCCLGGEREFTHFPVCLARLQATQQQKRPNSKKKKHGFRPISCHPCSCPPFWRSRHPRKCHHL